MLKAKDYRAKAREALKGKWKQASIAGLIAGVLGATILYQGYTGSSAGSATEDSVQSLSGFSFETILAAVGIIVVVAAVMILIGSLVGLGYAKFNLSLFEEEKADFKMIFSERKRYKDCFVLYVLQTIFITIGSILFVIPGIIAFYALVMAPYIMVDNPELTAMQALKESRAMMKGNKWKLFGQDFGLALASIILVPFTLGLAGFLIPPTRSAIYAVFYDELKKLQNEATAEEAAPAEAAAEAE